MTARQVLNAKAGQKVGLGNGLRLVCDKRNDGRYSSYVSASVGRTTRGASETLKP